ncbi:hypothetical protein PRO82_000823 [Candidatus Protochlamydia amoebophila]|nr:hypothetical protein [Candidatus Protochlamydia amoebophila]
MQGCFLWELAFPFFLKPKNIHLIMNDFLRISHFSILKNITFFNGFYVYF